MKFRDIAKLHAYNKGLKAAITSADLDYYIGVLGDEGSATPARVDRANEALETLGDSLAKKWSLTKKFLSAGVPSLAKAAEDDGDE